MQKMTLLLESQPRYAGFWKASDGKWYLDMADHPEPESEYDEDGEERDYYGPEGQYEDSTTYGPFPSQQAADDFMSSNWANPGSFYEDDSGKKPPPKKSPNGRPIESPGSSGRRSGVGYYGFGGSYGSGGFSTGARDYFTRPSTPKPAAAPAPAPAPKPAAATPAPVAPAGKAAQPPAKQAEKPKGPKTTYKVYNGTGTGKAVTGSSPIHTRIKGRVYAPTGISKFKPNDKASVAIDPDGKSAKVTDGDRSQVWTHREAFEQLIGEFIELMND